MNNLNKLRQVIGRKICKIFGHKFNPVLLEMFRIENEPHNKGVFKDSKIECGRCGVLFRYKRKTVEEVKRYNICGECGASNSCKNVNFKEYMEIKTKFNLVVKKI